MISIQLLLFYLSTSYAAQNINTGKFKIESNAGHFPQRLIKMMITYYEESNLKIREVNPLRFMFEESPHFEQGYIMHLIIERYRKMVELLKKQYEPSTYVLSSIERHYEIQKLYMEIPHLVNMMHEIPIKWRIVPEFDDPKQVKRDKKEDEKHFKETAAAYARIAKDKAKEKKKRLKLLKKFDPDKLKSTPKPGAKREPYNQLWPIDYGWEIDKMPSDDDYQESE